MNNYTHELSLYLPSSTLHFVKRFHHVGSRCQGVQRGPDAKVSRFQFLQIYIRWRAVQRMRCLWYSWAQNYWKSIECFMDLQFPKQRSTSNAELGTCSWWPASSRSSSSSRQASYGCWGWHNAVAYDDLRWVRQWRKLPQVCTGG